VMDKWRLGVERDVFFQARVEVPYEIITHVSLLLIVVAN
jgi:hypothetical protein